MTFFTDPYLVDHWKIFSSILGIVCGIYVMSKSNTNILNNNNNTSLIGWSLVVLITVWFGCRPLWAYVDTQGYTLIFNMVQNGELSGLPSEERSEWLFDTIEYFCIDYADAHTWLLVIASFYILCMALSIKGWFPNNFSIAIVFCVTSFSFFAYGTNGIRNGMATSIAMLGLFYLSKQTNKIHPFQIILALTILYLSTAVHKSCLLIIASSISAFFYRRTKVYFVIWILCILLSLVVGESIKQLFASVIEDERSAYLLAEVDEHYFSKTGFRWDFILYSSVPILLGMIVLKKRVRNDETYIFLLNTYIIANAFWCSINSTANSNRFAYLSWFLMPIILAYPLLNIKVFKNQGFVCGCFIIGGVIFNLLF